MKKILALILIMLMLPQVSAFAISLDVTSMSDADLQDVIDKASTELKKRELTDAGNIVVADAPELKAYITGRYQINQKNTDQIYFTIETVYINNCDFDITIIPNNVCVDGWDCETNMFDNMVELPANKMKKTNITFTLSDAGYSTMEEMHNIEFSFKLYRPDNIITPFTTTSSIRYVR